MKLIKEKYRTLGPSIELLSDEVIIAQAWKKTHAYMRLRNWYADTLALDISALGLESDAAAWAKRLTAGSGPVALGKLELVPAAKSEPWVVDEKLGWIPLSVQKGEEDKRNQKPPLRPLAHQTVRDQTWATAVMLCLADKVETRQGDCSERNWFRAQKNKVYSYGNRLVCDWKEDGQAWFRWGNAETYRRFFTDYQSFLKRPVEVGRSVEDGRGATGQVAVVQLDISRFYDRIERAVLLQRLRGLYADDRSETDELFWARVGEIFGWEWDEEAKELADSLGITLGIGLPQGLVAAGFFANAYLIDFDRTVGEAIGSSVGSGCRFVVHDYCRYVDDLRLVVEVEGLLDLSVLEASVFDWISQILKDKGGTALEFNRAKTQVTALEDLDNRGALSERVAQLQAEVSGPADRDSLEAVQGALEGLLTLQASTPEIDPGVPDAALVRITRFDHDIRTDTLKRFAANRLERVLRNKRRVAPELNEDSSRRHVIDNESELLAKKLIWAWMQDPSLGLVLRKAIEIFPSPEVVEPVLEALFARCNFANDAVDQVTGAMADYIVADLFRACVDLHGSFQRFDYPDSSDPAGLLALVCRHAQKAMAIGELPRFVERQALLLLAVMGKPVRMSGTDNTIQHSLHAILAGMPVHLVRQRLALYEVAAQITGNDNAVAAQLIEAMDGFDDEHREKVLDEFSRRGGNFWNCLWRRLKRSKRYDSLLEGYQWAAPQPAGSPRNGRQVLARIIASDRNGFVHEAGLVKLALGLLELLQAWEDSPLDSPISPKNIQVEQVPRKGPLSWALLWRPEVTGVSCPKLVNTLISDPRFEVPPWVDDAADARTIYQLGTLLRAASVGNNDFTSSRWKKSVVIGYKGLRTGWFKRRMGMMHSPEALVGEFATLSGWSSELLMTCLQWPGFEASHISHRPIAEMGSVEDLTDLLRTRLKKLNALYCSASEVPVLPTRVKRPGKPRDDDFRIVTVQQLLPRASEFNASDPTLDNPVQRRRGRDHLSRVCSLTYKILTTTVAAQAKKPESKADLIVFSELAVHPDDVDLLKRLSDKTRSMILAGLVFTERDGKLINIARWIIPDYRDSGRQWIIRDQGKHYPTKSETPLGVVGHRPCQHIIEVDGFVDGPFRISASICYDATDISLAADLKGKLDLFVIPAHNKDISTFDTMASALQYHMYQHVALVNKGEFGGSTIQAPFREQFHRLISHAHGNEQISINVADLDLAAFRRTGPRRDKEVKEPPAGYLKQ